MEKKTILVVDDTVSNLKRIDQVLRDEYQLVLLTSGRLAMQYLEDNVPDLIILDVEMPDMNGYETIRRIKMTPTLANVPVIFFTGLSDNESELMGLGYGAVDYVSKPVMPELLLHRVRMQLELHSYRYQLESLVDAKTRQLILLKRVTIGALASLAECRDAETGGHIKRTSRYVEVLCRALAQSAVYGQVLDDEMVDNIITSAPLHDIGKMSTPDYILNKPDRLTEQEYEAMKLHVAIGEESLRRATCELGYPSFLDVALDMCATHHERWDGKGYLRGLSGEDIPLSGRIMAIADVYDALVTKRPYKKALSHSEAVQIITEGRGTQFDPHMVDVFLDYEQEFEFISQTCQD